MALIMACMLMLELELVLMLMLTLTLTMASMMMLTMTHAHSMWALGRSCQCCEQPRVRSLCLHRCLGQACPEESLACRARQMAASLMILEVSK